MKPITVNFGRQASFPIFLTDPPSSLWSWIDSDEFDLNRIAWTCKWFQSNFTFCNILPHLPCRFSPTTVSGRRRGWHPTLLWDRSTLHWGAPMDWCRCLQYVMIRCSDMFGTLCHSDWISHDESSHDFSHWHTRIDTCMRLPLIFQKHFNGFRGEVSGD